MNERIRELAEQANITIRGHYDESGSTPLELEKFAQLIVRECANRIDYWESRQGEHSDDLLKHFGIKSD